MGALEPIPNGISRYPDTVNDRFGQIAGKNILVQIGAANDGDIAAIDLINLPFGQRHSQWKTMYVRIPYQPPDGGLDDGIAGIVSLDAGGKRANLIACFRAGFSITTKINHQNHLSANLMT